MQGLSAPTFPFAIYCRNIVDFGEALPMLGIIEGIENQMTPRRMAQHLSTHPDVARMFGNISKFHAVLSGRNQRPCIYLHWYVSFAFEESQ